MVNEYESFYKGLTQNRKNFVEQISYLILNELEEMEKIKNYDPESSINTMAINSSFGMGKSYFAKGLTYYLREEAVKNSGLEKIEIINYNAWENDFFEDPMKTILYHILSKIGNDSRFEVEASSKIKKIMGETCDAIDDIIKIPMFKISKILASSGEVTSLEEYKEYLTVIEAAKKILEEQAIFFNKKYKPKIIIIDELDRCKPNFSIEVLESIKHFFNIKGLYFIFLVNKKQLKESAQNIFGKFGSEECYFQKFFDLEFNLPLLNYDEYIQNKFESLSDSTEFLELVNDLYKVNIDIFSEVIFLDFYKRIVDTSKISVREFKKKFSKFKILIKSIKRKEKENLTLLLSITLIFLNKEFLKLDKSNLLDKFFNSYFLKEKENYQIDNNPICFEKTPNFFQNFNFKFDIISLYFDIFIRSLGKDPSYSIQTIINEYKRVDVQVGSSINKGKLDEIEIKIDDLKISNLEQKIEITKNSREYSSRYRLCVPLNSEFLRESYKKGENPIIDWCERKCSLLDSLYFEE